MKETVTRIGVALALALISLAPSGCRSDKALAEYAQVAAKFDALTAKQSRLSCDSQNTHYKLQIFSKWADKLPKLEGGVHLENGVLINNMGVTESTYRYLTGLHDVTRMTEDTRRWICLRFWVASGATRINDPHVATLLADAYWAAPYGFTVALQRAMRDSLTGEGSLTGALNDAQLACLNSLAPERAAALINAVRLAWLRQYPCDYARLNIGIVNRIKQL